MSATDWMRESLLHTGLVAEFDQLVSIRDAVLDGAFVDAQELAQPQPKTAPDGWDCADAFILGEQPR